MITENVSTLKINKLTQAQYDREFAAGNIDENALYLTPDDTAETYMTKNNPTGTGSFSLNRKAYSDIGNYSFAEGYNTISSGEASHAEGTQTIASGYDSHAEGFTTEASGVASHSEGYKTIASGVASHAEGGRYILSPNGDLEDSTTRTISATSYPIIGDTDITISSTTAQGVQSHAEGTQTFAFGYSSHAEGYKTNALGKYSHAEGGYCGPYARASTASGDNSHAEGKGTLASGEVSHAEGQGATASGNVSHAEGSGTEASGEASHAEGSGTDAIGDYSHAEGRTTEASGEASHAEGINTEAKGHYSHAEGLSTIALGANQHVQGKFNIGDTTNTYAHIVGNGSFKTPSNAHTLDWNGNAWFAGGVTVGANKIPLATTNIATTSTNGLMSSADKVKLNSIAANANNFTYTHPSSHAATMITTDSTHRFVTDSQISTWNGKQNSLGFTPIQQGGGTGQATNKIYIGWSNEGKLKAQVDKTNLGNIALESWAMPASKFVTGTYVYNGAATTSFSFTNSAVNGKGLIICGTQDAGNAVIRASISGSTITVIVATAVTVMRVNYICF